METGYETEVRSGAGALDRSEPRYAMRHWWQKIDLDKLDLADRDECILAQLFGSYEYGLLVLHDAEGDEEFAVANGFDIDQDEVRPPELADCDEDDVDAWAERVGYDPEDPQGDHAAAREYQLLTSAWRALIEARRETGE